MVREKARAFCGGHGLTQDAAVTYYLYGLSGERLVAMTETCSGSCTAYTENERWIYFAGKKMFSKTPSTLKAVTPNRLASEAKHYPYGEVQGTAPTDTKDYFATYRRDETGLDYAWNRYYSPTMGRFTTPDPYGGSANVRDPQSWNRYAYVSNNPISFVDPTGEFISVVPGETKTYVVFIPLYDRIGMRCLLNPALCGEHSGKMDLTGNVALRSELGGAAGKREDPEEQARQKAVQLMEKAQKAVIEEMKNNADCANLFSGGAEAVQALIDGLNTGSIGSIKYVESNLDAYVDEAPGSGVTPVFGDPKSNNLELYINISAKGTGYWNQTTDIKRARTLIHELGHVANMSIEGYGSLFNDRDNISAYEDGKLAQDYNQSLEERCFKDQ